MSCEQLCRSLQRAQEKLDVEHRAATTTWWEVFVGGGFFVDLFLLGGGKFEGEGGLLISEEVWG